MTKNRNNTGAFFINTRKDINKKEDQKKPDYTGLITLDNQKYYLSIWKRIAKKTGNTFYSIAASKANADFSYKDPDTENNRGAIFKNNKSDTKNPPLFTGKGKFNGEHYYLEVWEVQGKEQIFYSIQLQKYEVKENNEFNQEKQNDGSFNQEKQNDDSFNQEIPFDVDNENQDNEYNQETPSSTAFNIFTLGQE